MSGITGFSAEHVAKAKERKAKQQARLAQFNLPGKHWLRRLPPIIHKGVDHGNRQSYSAVYLYPITPPYLAYSGTFTTLGTVSERQRDAARSIPREGVRAGEVVAYRVWEVYAEHLRSVSMKILWAPGGLMTGDVGNGDGIYCFKEMEQAKGLACEYGFFKFNPHVAGSIEIWGDIVEHEHGYRAQYAAIKSLDAISGGVWREADTERLDRLREKYLDAPADDL